MSKDNGAGWGDAVFSAGILIVAVGQCSRCKGEHGEIEFKPLTLNESRWSHWGVCPTYNEPMLLRKPA